jgi:hypothetical protein
MLVLRNLLILINISRATKCPQNYTSYVINFNSGCFRVQSYDFKSLCCPNNVANSNKSNIWMTVLCVLLIFILN